MKWLEKHENLFDIVYLLLLLGFLLSTFYYSIIDKEPASLIIKFLPFILLLGVVITTGMWIYKINRAGKKELNAEEYAKLQAEKDEFKIVSGGLSIEGLISQLGIFSKENYYLLSLTTFFILLCAIGYRHLAYAIYMQEHYKKEAEKKLSCPFSPPLKGTMCTPETSNDNELNDGNTLHIIYNGKETPNIHKIIKEDTEQAINATKVFLSFSVK